MATRGTFSFNPWSRDHITHINGLRAAWNLLLRSIEQFPGYRLCGRLRAAKQIQKSSEFDLDRSNLAFQTFAALALT